jgi:uncharacterized caspase-like protein
VRFGLGIFLMAGFLAASTTAGAETRIALVIGNGNYAVSNLKLANPTNDAVTMQRSLQAAGFTVIMKLNAKRLDFYRLVQEFGDQIGRDPHAVGLFYYAGHGVQAGGENYLIPVDADIQSDAELEASAYAAGRVLRAMKDARNEMNIVILDACRDNPLPKTTRGVERGLARMDAPSGTFIAYAAGPGQSAHDGAMGTNGVFTGELVKAMAKPGVPLEQMFKKVIAGVKADTHGEQQPWSEASIQGDFYFHAGQAEISSPAPSAALDAVAARPATAPQTAEFAAFKAAQDSDTVSGWQIFEKKYPHSEYGATADIRIAALSKPHSAATSDAPPAAPPAQAAPQPEDSDAPSPHFGFAWAQKVQTTATRVGTAQYSPLPANGDVAVYKSPDEVKSPFEVLAVLAHSDPCKFHTCSLSDAIAPLSAKAREVGANAIIIDKSQTVKTSLMSTGISVSGRAIRLGKQ